MKELFVSTLWICAAASTVSLTAMLLLKLYKKLFPGIELPRVTEKVVAAPLVEPEPEEPMKQKNVQKKAPEQTEEQVPDEIECGNCTHLVKSHPIESRLVDDVMCVIYECEHCNEKLQLPI